MDKYFRTRVEVESIKEKIDFSKSLFLLGSCFTENIGSKLEYYKFKCQINPFGILYNPISIAQSLESLLDTNYSFDLNLHKENDIYFSYDFHGDFSSLNKDSAINNMSQSFNKAKETIKNTSFLIISFGTSWVYQLISTKKIVANCHKQGAHLFKRFRLSPKSIVNRYLELIQRIQEINPNIKVIFTLSPIRHLKDGPHENQLSKSTLLLAISEICKQSDISNYFPSYEILLDELRDYRFYAKDMIHPSDLAVNYIWEIFKENHISESAYACMEEVSKLQLALNHKPQYPESSAYKNFLNNQLKKTLDLKKKYTFLELDKEINLLRRLI